VTRIRAALAFFLAAAPLLGSALLLLGDIAILEPDAAVLARLFELAPEQHADYRQAYLRARRKDSEARTREKRSDAAMMRRFSVSIWVVLIVIWALYGLFVANTLLKQK